MGWWGLRTSFRGTFDCPKEEILSARKGIIFVSGVNKNLGYIYNNSQLKVYGLILGL